MEDVYQIPVEGLTTQNNRLQNLYRLMPLQITEDVTCSLEDRRQSHTQKC